MGTDLFLTEISAFLPGDPAPTISVKKMLKKSPIRQIDGEPEREFWTDGMMELLIWKEEDGIRGFEITLQKDRVFKWIEGQSPIYGVIDSDETKPGRHPANVIDEQFNPAPEFREQFSSRGTELPTTLKRFILDRLPIDQTD